LAKVGDVYAHLCEYKFWKDSKKGWRSEGVAEIAVVRYSSTSSFGGFGLFEEGCAEDDMTQDDKVDEMRDA
jgi:hypothetical protein